MMKAILQGEFHISGSDEQSLQSRLEEDVDALFIEGRNDSVGPDDWSLGYLLFIIGALIIFWFQEAFDTVSDTKDEVSIPVFDEIDTPLPELYERFPREWTIPAGLFSGLVFFTGIYAQKIPVPILPSTPLVGLAYTYTAKLILVIGGVVAFSAILISLEERRLGSRDEDMVESITDISEEHQFDKVVISCGEKHLNRLPDLMEEKGWDVEVYSTNHSWAAKLWGL